MDRKRQLTPGLVPNRHRARSLGHARTRKQSVGLAPGLYAGLKSEDMVHLTVRRLRLGGSVNEDCVIGRAATVNVLDGDNNVAGKGARRLSRPGRFRP